jgi:hypothetical protein
VPKGNLKTRPPCSSPSLSLSRFSTPARVAAAAAPSLLAVLEARGVAAAVGRAADGRGEEELVGAVCAQAGRRPVGDTRRRQGRGRRPPDPQAARREPAASPCRDGDDDDVDRVRAPLPPSLFFHCQRRLRSVIFLAVFSPKLHTYSTVASCVIVAEFSVDRISS